MFELAGPHLFESVECMMMLLNWSLFPSSLHKSRCFKILGGVGREKVVGGSKAREDDNIQHPLQESQDSGWISGH
jgi:hypothetical protein